jgi:Cytochrome c7 and related cytochrome c
MKFKFFYLLFIPILASALTLMAFSSGDSTGVKYRNKELIKFSHKFHLDGITDCGSCHTGVAKSTSLNDMLLPTMNDCAQCHDVEDEKNCKMCHYGDNFEPLIQKKVNLTFNHSFHVTKQKLECETCHKGLATVDNSWELKNPDPVMDDCYSCHNNNNSKTLAIDNCQSCHTSTADLKPQSHKSANFISSHKFAAKDIKANCVMCHDNSNNSCEDCHTSNNTITEANTPDDFFQPYSPGSSVKGPKDQKVTRIHDLNYIQTHGIDLKGKTAECQSCHEVESFCVKCHQSDNADFSMSGVAPYSHTQPNFTTIGVGTGGGEHAILARRDIENCAACHDVQGGDPTCITCHLDSDGIKGTNPKTHPANFMHGDHGDWHDSQGSICFNCHTSASPSTPSGVGFCGYCHGSQPR